MNDIYTIFIHLHIQLETIIMETLVDTVFNLDIKTLIFERYIEHYEEQVLKYIEQTLNINKDCKIFQVDLNDYTDFLQISFLKHEEYKCIMYRVCIIQTNPNVRNTFTGHCFNIDEFDKFLKQTIEDFIESTNKTKNYNDWEASLVMADEAKKRHNIKSWEGNGIDNFNEKVTVIFQDVLKEVS